MKKPVAIYIITILLCISKLHAQFINGSFEEWDTVYSELRMDTFTEPVGWFSTNEPFYTRNMGRSIFISEDATEGSYSAKVTSGYISQNVSTMDIDKVTYSLRCDSLDLIACCLMVIFTLDENGEIMDQVYSKKYPKSDSFAYEEVIITEDMKATDSIQIGFNAFNDIFHYEGPGYCSMTVDDVNVSYLSATKETTESNVIKIIPNPASDYIRMDMTVSESVLYEIYDIQGARWKAGYYNNEDIDISDLAVGVYFLKLDSIKGIIFSKFIKAE